MLVAISYFEIVEIVENLNKWWINQIITLEGSIL